MRRSRLLLGLATSLLLSGSAQAAKESSADDCVAPDCQNANAVTLSVGNSAASSIAATAATLSLSSVRLADTNASLTAVNRVLETPAADVARASSSVRLVTIVTLPPIPDIDSHVAAVPEPSAALLFGVGVLVVGRQLRRR